MKTHLSLTRIAVIVRGISLDRSVCGHFQQNSFEGAVSSLQPRLKGNILQDVIYSH